MTVLTDCPHGMPSRAACVDCMEDGPVATPTSWEKVGDPFRARFDGECKCGRPIVAGASRVQRWDRTDGSRTVYTHDECRP